ncbi:MAG: DUF202 domain-containing protein [Acidimicrobiales bacterium]
MGALSKPERRWSKVVDPGLQQERTALAWERTAIAIMVSGVLLARYAAQSSHWSTALIGLAQTMAGGGLLVWAGVHYAELRGPLLEGTAVVHPVATRVIGLGTVAFSAAALGFAVLEITLR